ncbi:MAG TPA: site-2 protease family protein [Ktedonobacterales bacterium]
MNVIVVVETFIAFVIAVTLHEASHAAMAALLGDGTPGGAGRLSLNPRRHMAGIGALVALTLCFGIPLGGQPVGLGWGKPVEVDTRRMRVGPDLGVFLVALSGPVFSLIMGLLFSIPLHFMPGYNSLTNFTYRCLGGSGELLQTCMSHAQPVWLLRLDQFLFLLAATNILLALLNLIPLYPLDGYHMVFALLPNDPAVRLRNAQGYMEFALLVIFFVIPYMLQIVHLDALNPGYWLGQWSMQLASRIAGPAYQLFVYQL